MKKYHVKATNGVRCRAGLCFNIEGGVVHNPGAAVLAQLQSDPYLHVEEVAEETPQSVGKDAAKTPATPRATKAGGRKPVTPKTQKAKTTDSEAVGDTQATSEESK